MSRRPRRIIPATIVALLILALGAYAATASIGSLLGQDPTRSLTPLADRLSASPWNDPAVLSAGIVLLVIGVILLLCGVLPGRQVILALQSPDGPSSDRPSSIKSTSDRPSAAGVTRGSITHAVQDAAAGVDGVSSAHVRVKGRRVDVLSQAAARDTTGLAGRVETAVVERLAGIPLAKQPQVKVRVTAARSEP